ncbi:MAG TPA: TM0106 family RecB-like putative nuclease [Nitrospira sp.]|nr:TM0106 family RecB-like putative nuclease [Nitrospira sp.]
MKKHHSGQLLFSPSDLVRYLASPFASWMDRYYLEHPDAVTPDAQSEEERLIAESGQAHEEAVLGGLKAAPAGVCEIRAGNLAEARDKTLAAIRSKAPVIYQAAMHSGQFAGYADFLMLDQAGRYQVWDTKLARSPKPFYAIQLCCYADLLAEMTGAPSSDRFGIILGTKERVQFRLEDFIHFYRQVRQSFLRMQDRYTGRLQDCPEPLPRAEQYQWTSHAERFFNERDHLVKVANITVGQIKKLHRAGVTTMTELAQAGGRTVPRLNQASLDKLAAQARLQCQTRELRRTSPDAPPCYEVLPSRGGHGGPGRADGELTGLAALPPADPADVFFDMEGYPLAPGGLEYLFGVCTLNAKTGAYEFQDWWAHDRAEEKRAFESVVDWVSERWRRYPAMHIYHYADYEVSAVRRLSTHHDTRQEAVDQLLRHEVFVDLYRIVRQGLRIGEHSYSIKTVERLYRPKRATEVATAGDSIVQYSRWRDSGEPGDWNKSPILKGIRDYNEDDCRSTAHLAQWLRDVAKAHGIEPVIPVPAPETIIDRELPPGAGVRRELAAQLRQNDDGPSRVLADVVDFHRREEKPMWWRMFDRAAASPEERRDDPGCIEGLQADGDCVTEKKSLAQAYRFDPAQECKLGEGDSVRFVHHLDAGFGIAAIDPSAGRVTLKIGKKTLDERCRGQFPKRGALIAYEYVNAAPIPDALTAVAEGRRSGRLHPPAAALLERRPPALAMQQPQESTIDAAIRIARHMSGSCLVIQGPPGTGKTFAASQVISALLADHKRIGIASNSHKAVMNLLKACGEAARNAGGTLEGIKVGGEPDEAFLNTNTSMTHVPASGDARSLYHTGVVGGTAWLFSRSDWEGVLDYLFIDEAGQVSLANAIAMSRCTANLVLLGDQMQLEQPIQGAHPGDAGLSVLQFALKDVEASAVDVPVFHAVVPQDYGLFLGQSRRMHPDVCRFISESIYEGRLTAHPDCAGQRIAAAGPFITEQAGIVFSPVEHDGNIQHSAEEMARVTAIYQELLGRPYQDKDGRERPLALNDFLFIAPYNAQVRGLQAVLPPGARVGSVDKFQGQEAPVCILSLCSSYGEYGSRGLGFILDRNRINVAISRAQCLAVIVADPRIAGTIPSTLDEMMLINLFCKVTQQPGAFVNTGNPF